MKKELDVVKPNIQALKDPKKMKEDPQDVVMKEDEEKTDPATEKKDPDLLTLEGIKTFIEFVVFPL